MKKIISRIKIHIISPVIIHLGKQIEEKRFNGIPIIIGACPRSGSTLLLSILGGCDKIFPVPNQTAAFYHWKLLMDPDSGQVTFSPSRIDRLYREIIYNRIPISATRWLEKTPRHIQHFKNILGYYGKRILLINMIRDGRDVVTSKHPKHRPDKYYADVDRWVNDAEIGLQFKDHPQVLTVRYEDIIKDFEKSMIRIYTFIGEEVPDALYEWKQNTSITHSKHWEKPVQDLYSHSISRWRKPEHKKRIDEFMQNPRAVTLLKELGYE